MCWEKKGPHPSHVLYESNVCYAVALARDQQNIMQNIVREWKWYEQQRRREKKKYVLLFSAFDPIECFYSCLLPVFIGFLYTGALLFHTKSPCSYAHTPRRFVFMCSERGSGQHTIGWIVRFTYTATSQTVTIEYSEAQFPCVYAKCDVVSSCSNQSHIAL